MLCFFFDVLEVLDSLRLFLVMEVVVVVEEKEEY